jgi:hypothetical protein
MAYYTVAHFLQGDTFRGNGSHNALNISPDQVPILFIVSIANFFHRQYRQFYSSSVSPILFIVSIAKFTFFQRPKSFTDIF